MVGALTTATGGIHTVGALTASLHLLHKFGADDAGWHCNNRVAANHSKGGDKLTERCLWSNVSLAYGRGFSETMTIRRETREWRSAAKPFSETMMMNDSAKR